jgi:hypothetical protein
VTAIVALATALAAAFTFLFRRLMKRRARTTARIELRIPQELADDNRLEFGLRHVRDGKSEATGQGPLLNSDTWFRQGSGAGLTASVRYTAALGFQFKCFVQFRQMTFDELAALLGDQAADVVADLEPDGDNPKRAWFLLTSYQPVTTPDGLTNNFVYPGDRRTETSAP